MEPFEVMISESQERMLAVIEPSNVSEAIAVCRKWGLDANVVGSIDTTGTVTVHSEGDIVAQVPADALAEEGPVYERPIERPAWADEIAAADRGDAAPADLQVAFMTVLTSPAIASKRWVWEQYDHMIFLGTIQGPGGDAAVIRLPDTDTAVAITVDGPGRYCYLDPYEGARLAVAEAARNVAATGARPLAITNCLNFGSPEKPEVMWQFSETVRGIRDACLAFETPVTGGNVSFYNETNDRPIFPTPVIGMLGVLDSPGSNVGLAFREEGDTIVLLGSTSRDDFGGSEYAKVVNDTIGGPPPALDVGAEKALHSLLHQAAAEGVLRSSHDLSGGGLAIALAESAIAGARGIKVELDADHAVLFSETPSRCVVSCAPTALQQLLGLASSAGVPASVLGSVSGPDIDLGAFKVSLTEAREAFESVLSRTLSTTMSGS